MDQTLTMYTNSAFTRPIPQDDTGIKAVVPIQPKTFQDLLQVGALNFPAGALRMSMEDMEHCLEESKKSFKQTSSQRHYLHWIMVTVQLIKMAKGLDIVTYDQWRAWLDDHGPVNLAYRAVYLEWSSSETAKGNPFREEENIQNARLITDLSFFLIEASFHAEWSWVSFNADKHNWSRDTVQRKLVD